MKMLSKNILGVATYGHDPGAAIISRNGIVAISEERLNRVKHSRNVFANLSVRYCLQTLGLRPEEIDLVVGKEGPGFEAFKKEYGTMFPNAEIVYVGHHDAHAASAFFVSPFEEAAILVVDGGGQKVKNHYGINGFETETLYRGKGNKIYCIQKTTHIERFRHSRETIGIGALYSLISDHYLNFGVYNEGKLMGLAPYGKNKIAFGEWFRTVGDHIVCNPRIIYGGANMERGGWDKLSLRGKISRNARELLIEAAYKLFRLADRKGNQVVISKSGIFKEIEFSLSRRKRDEPLPQEYYADVAYTAQKVLEEVVIGWGKKLMNVTGLTNLAFAGGVGLNIDANKRLMDDAGYKGLFVQPAASDAGIPLGAAFWGAHQYLNLPRFYEMKSASLGRTYFEKEIREAIDKFQGVIHVRKASDIAKETAKFLSDGKIIGWFYGGCEYGPRALGNRSILADARHPDMRDILNSRVKHRESWRPFAAAVLLENMREWFELDQESPFMLLAAQVVRDKQKLIPSVTHVDGTCRIQSVTKEANGKYYDLINEFKKLTGVPLILNTSFNLGGEPIVETPTDALDTFLRTNIDYLVLEDYIISKK